MAANRFGLRFSCKLQLAGVTDGSAEEIAYGKIVVQDYMKTVDATRAATRKAKPARDALIKRYYEAVDAMDFETFKSLHSQSARMTFANFPAASTAGTTRTKRSSRPP